jgi:hypothetical protein
MASPGLTTASNYTNAYIGAETFLNKREIYKGIFNKYREPEGLIDMLINLGFKKKSANTTFHWWEHDFLINSVTIASVNFQGGGAGVSMIVTIDAASHQEGGKNSFFNAKDLVMVGEMRGYIESVNKTVDGAHTYTIKPVEPTEDWGVDATPTPALGVDIVGYGNAHHDGSGQPGSKIRKPVKYLNYTQIMKYQYLMHKSEAANEAEVLVKGKPYYYRQGVEDVFDRLMIDLEYTLLLGQQSNNLVAPDQPAGAGAITTTEGLQKSVENRGITQTYVNWDYAESEKMIRSLDKERAANEYCGLLGTDLYIDHEAAMHTRTQNTSIDFSMFYRNVPGYTNAEASKKSAFQKAAGSKALSFQVDSYRLGGRTFHMKKWESLNYTPVTGYSNSKYPERGFFLPMGITKDPKDGYGMDCVSLMYKKNDMENRFMKEWTRGQEITNLDQHEWNYQMEMGLRLAKVNAYLTAEK